MAGDAATELRRIARQVQSFPRSIVNDATKTLQKAATKRLAQDTGGDRSLSGAPGKLSVTRSVKGETVVTGKVAADGRRGGAGRWSWLEHGTGEPGPTAAKNTWTEAVDPVVDTLNTEIAEAFRKATS